MTSADYFAGTTRYRGRGGALERSPRSAFGQRHRIERRQLPRRTGNRARILRRCLRVFPKTPDQVLVNGQPATIWPPPPPSELPGAAADAAGPATFLVAPEGRNWPPARPSSPTPAPESSCSTARSRQARRGSDQDSTVNNASNSAASGSILRFSPPAMDPWTRRNPPPSR